MLRRIEVHVVIAFTNRCRANDRVSLANVFRRKMLYCLYIEHNLRSIHDEREWNSVKAETTFV